MPAYHLLYLDRYHLGDPLFLQSLARALAGAGPGQPGTVLVHGSGEEAERLLEAEGLFLEREDGILQVSSAGEAALVQRAVRQLNRTLVALFTDAAVATVGLMGTDRRLLEVQPDGALTVHGAGWLKGLLDRRVVPIVGALAREAGQGRIGEVATDAAVAAIGQAMGPEDVRVVVFTRSNLPGIMEGRATVPEVSIEDVQDDRIVPEPDAVRRVLSAGLSVLLTNTARLVGASGAAGTRVVR